MKSQVLVDQKDSVFHDFVQYNEGTDHLWGINIGRLIVQAVFHIFGTKYNGEVWERRKS